MFSTAQAAERQGRGGGFGMEGGCSIEECAHAMLVVMVGFGVWCVGCCVFLA